MQDLSFLTRSSVPQGSHCGPLLFLIMTAFIPSCLINTQANLQSFADDTKFISIVNSDEQRKSLQMAIDKLSKWSNENKMELNTTRTYHVTYTQYELPRFATTYYLGAHRIQRREQIKDLGVLFDHQLTFKPHIQSLKI